MLSFGSIHVSGPVSVKTNSRGSVGRGRLACILLTVKWSKKNKIPLKTHVPIYCYFGVFIHIRIHIITIVYKRRRLFSISVGIRSAYTPCQLLLLFLCQRDRQKPTTVGNIINSFRCCLLKKNYCRLFTLIHTKITIRCVV